MEPANRSEVRNAYQDNPRFVAAITGTVNNKSMRIHSAVGRNANDSSLNATSRFKNAAAQIQRLSAASASNTAAAPIPKITISGSITLLKLGSNSRRSAIGCSH